MVTIDKIKRQLNIELTYDSDDQILQTFIDVADAAVTNYCGEDALTGYTNETMPTPVIQAVVLFATHMYMNRNMVAFSQGTEIPYSFRFLLDPYKNYVIQ